MVDILQYAFFQKALLGALLASVVYGFIGTYVVTRRLVFISGGITHASFGGVGLGVFLGISPILSAFVFAVLSALGVQWFSSQRGTRSDSAIALFWTLGMSLGIIFCFLTPSFIPDMSSFLFGSILTVSVSDLYVLGGVTLIVLLTFFLLYRLIVSVSFDAVFARSRYLPVGFVEYLMMTLVAMTVVATLRIVGVMMSISMLTIPQMTANLLTHDLKKMIMWSVLLGLADSVVGLCLSYYINVPSGATIIFVSIMVYLLLKFCTSSFISSRQG